MYKSLMFISPNYDSKLRYSFGIVDNDNAYLKAILNKSIQLTNAHEIDNIIYQSSQQVKMFSILQYIQDNLFVSILVFVAIVATGISLLLLYYQNQLKMKKKTELEYKRYLTLAEITNEIIFEYDYSKKQLSFSKTDDQFEEQELVFKNHMQHANDENNPIVLTFHDLLMQKNIDTEICTYPKVGEECWYRIIMKVIYDDEEVVYAIGKAINIHEQKIEKDRLVKESMIDSLTEVYNAVTCKKTNC